MTASADYGRASPPAAPPERNTVLMPPVDTSSRTPLHDLSLDLPLREARDAFERVYFEHHLAREGGSMTRVADKTGLERTHLYRKLKQLGIELSRKRNV